MHGGRLLSLRRQWRGFWPSWMLVGFCLCFTSLLLLLLAGFGYAATVWLVFPIAKVFRHPLFLNTHTHSEHKTEKVKCRIESKRRRAHPASQPKRFNEPSYNFPPEHFPTVKTQRRILLRLSLFGFSFLLAAPPFLKHWNPTEMRRVLTFDGLISTAQSKPAPSIRPTTPLAVVDVVVVKSNSLCPLLWGLALRKDDKRTLKTACRLLLLYSSFRFFFSLCMYVRRPPFCAQRHLDNTTCHGGGGGGAKSDVSLNQHCRDLGVLGFSLVCIYAVRPVKHQQHYPLVILGCPVWISRHCLKIRRAK